MSETGPEAAITREQLDRALETMGKLLTFQIERDLESLRVRLDGNDKALELLASYPTAIDRAKEEMTTRLDAAISARKIEQEHAKELSTVQQGNSEQRFVEFKDSTQKLLDSVASTGRATTDVIAARIGFLNEKLAVNDGKSMGVANVWGLVVGGVGVAAFLFAMWDRARSTSIPVVPVAEIRAPANP